MTDDERLYLKAYLLETRRHYLALAKAAEVMLNALAAEEKAVYNKNDGKSEQKAKRAEVSA